MRFKPSPRSVFEDTERKRAAFRRKKQREQDALPLFADQIARKQRTDDEEMAGRTITWENSQNRDRRRRARDWRLARRLIGELPHATAMALRRIWNCAPYPADPSRLLGMIRDVEIGKLDPQKPPFPLSLTDHAGCRREDLFVCPGSFAEVNILDARKIAANPGPHALRDRRIAYHHLQTAASRNKDRDRAMADRVLASSLFLRIGGLEEEVAR